MKHPSVPNLGDLIDGITSRRVKALREAISNELHATDQLRLTLVETGRRIRYNNTVRAERAVGLAFVKAKAAQVRAEIRARGLNIPVS